MKNILIKTIQYTSIIGLGMLAFAGQALAAPALTPISVTYLSDTKATVVSKVFNQVQNNTTVWFEWGTTPTPITVIGLTDIFQQGYFQANLDKLTPGATYYFRAVAFEGGTTVYSPVVSVTTTGGVAPVGVVAPTYVQPVAPIVTYVQPAPAPVQEIVSVAPVQQKKVSSPQVTKKNTVTSVKNTTETVGTSALNPNSATVLGAGGNVLPGTLLEWMGLFIAIIVVIILVRMVIEANEKREKALEQARQKDLREAPLIA